MKLRINGRDYPVVDNPTLGELRILKREFDVQEVDQLNPKDPDHLAGLVYVSMHRADPSVTIEDVDAVQTVELLDDEGNVVDAPDEEAERPTADPAA